jgi:hypothetical protein
MDEGVRALSCLPKEGAVVKNKSTGVVGTVERVFWVTALFTGSKRLLRFSVVTESDYILSTDEDEWEVLDGASVIP